MAMITITTYQELNSFIKGFAAGCFNMLVVHSKGGLGKNQAVQRAMSGQDMVYVGGHVTPLKFYELICTAQDKPVVFPEIDDLLALPANVGLLKQVCETTEVKKVMWLSKDSRAAEIDGGRGYCYTRSHVLMLCNSFTSLSANVAALRTRATVVQFAPSPDQVLDQIKSFADDPEIVDFLERLHGAIYDFNLRTYAQLQELKAAGLPWQKYALDQSAVPAKVLEIANLILGLPTDLERVQRYSGSRRDFYNWKPKAMEYLDSLPPRREM